MFHPETSISIKTLKNKMYRIEPVKVKTRAGTIIQGIYLLWAKSGVRVWENNRGVIPLEKLSPQAQEYVLDKFGDKRLKVFKSLGD